MAPRVRKRCTKGGHRIPTGLRVCPKCGCTTYSWTAVYDTVKPRVTGSQKSIGSFETQEDAEAALVKVLNDLRQGNHVSPSSLTVRDFLQTWLVGRKGEVSDATLYANRNDIRRVIDKIGHLPMQSSALPARLRSMWPELAGSGLKVTTLRKSYDVLLTAFAAAVEQRLVARNPVYRTFRLKAARREMATWSYEELAFFLASQRNSRDYAMWRVAVMTWIRVGELVALKRSDLNLADGHIVVVHSMTQQNVDEIGSNSIRRRLVRGDTKLGGGRRLVDLDRQTLDALQDHLDQQAAERSALGGAYQETGYLFTKLDGSRLTPNGVYKMFKRVTRSLSLRPIRLHDLRHTGATLTLGAGNPIKEVQVRLGHSSSRITLDSYAHSIPMISREVTQRFADSVDRPVRPRILAAAD